jgi:hypothetical protein
VSQITSILANDVGSGKTPDTFDGSGLTRQGWSGCHTVIRVNGGLGGVQAFRPDWSVSKRGG